MFNNKHARKTKKIENQRWRLELSSYKYEIIYRLVKENIVADAYSRYGASMES